MKKFSAVLLLIAASFSLAYSQGKDSAPKTCVAFLPKAILNSSVLVETVANQLCHDPSWGQGKGNASTKKYWIVYSDRSENPAYYGPSVSSGIRKKVKFNQKMRIARISNGFAQVYTEFREDITYPSISKDIEYHGWIPMSNLLLWNSCLANDLGIYYKALLCLNLDQSNKEYLGVGFLNPSEKETSAINLQTDMNFYYVMKRNADGSVLLARECNMSGTSEQILKCWVTPESYIPWNQRSCLEPNWDPKAVEHFESQGKIAPIYDTKDLRRQVTWVNYRTKNGNRSDRYRLPASSIRYPILDGGTKNLYHFSVFSSFGTSVSDHEQLVATQKEKENKSLSALSQLRMAIVIDGTTSMDKYFPAVRSAINEACEFFSTGRYTIKVAVVIYRDYTEGQYLVEKLDWVSPDDPRLSDFLNTGGKFGIRSSSTDRTNTEAVFYGINYAAENLDFNSEQSNLMLVVGDCGNAQDDKNAPTIKALSRTLADKRIHFMGFQVRHEDIWDWDLFNNQMKGVLQTSLQNKYDNLLPGSTVHMKKSLDGFEMVNKSSQLFVGAHKYSVQGGELAPSKLTELMVESIKYCAQAIHEQQGVIVRKGGSGQHGFVSSSADLPKLQIDSAFFIERMGKEYFERSKKIRSLTTFAAYGPKNDADGVPYYKPVIFISSDELHELMDKLYTVDEVARNHSNDREPYLKAIKALIHSMIPDMSEAEMNKMGDREVMNLIAGLNETTATMNNYTLMEIADEMVVSREEYDRLLDTFQLKYRKIKNIMSNKDYPFAYTFNNVRYYWIPIDDLP